MKRKKLLKILLATGAVTNLTGCQLVDQIRDMFDTSYSYSDTSNATDSAGTKIKYVDQQTEKVFNENKQVVEQDYFVPYKSTVDVEPKFQTEFLSYLKNGKQYNVLINDNALENSTQYVQDALEYLGKIYSKISPSFSLLTYKASDVNTASNDYACYITYGTTSSGNVMSTSLNTLENGKKQAKIVINKQSVANQAKLWETRHISEECIVKKLVVSSFSTVAGFKHNSSEPNSAFHNGLTENCAWQYSPKDLKAITANLATINSNEDAKNYNLFIDEMANEYYSHLLKNYFEFAKKDSPTDEEKEAINTISSAHPTTIEDNRKLYLEAHMGRTTSTIAINEDKLQHYTDAETSGECYVIHNTEPSTMDKVKDFVVLENAVKSVKNSAEFYLPGNFGYQYTGKDTSNGEQIYMEASWCRIGTVSYSLPYFDLSASKYLSNKNAKHVNEIAFEDEAETL